VRKPSPELLRRLRRAAASTGFGLLVFVVALYVWFPYDRAKELAINVAAGQGLDLEIESVGPAFGIGLTFTNIHGKTRPTTGKSTRFSIESASVKRSLFSTLFFWSTPTYLVSLDAFGGHIDLSQSGSLGKKAPFRVEVSVRDVKLSDVPGIRESLNLPVTGTLGLEVDLATPTGKLATSKGALSFSCAACVLGDGKTPLKVEGNPFLGGGLTLPKVRVGDLRGEVAVENGTGKLKNVEAKSPDVELALEGDVQLRDPVGGSLVNAYLRFKLSDAFLKSAGTLQTLLQMAAAGGRRPDGGYGLRVGGRFLGLTTSLSPTSQLGGPAPPTRPSPRPGITQAYPPPPPPSQPPVPMPSEAPPPPSAMEMPQPPPPPQMPPAPVPVGAPPTTVEIPAPSGATGTLSGPAPVADPTVVVGAPAGEAPPAPPPPAAEEAQ
jgi:type II secretion system protein N